jgi:CelD/BcsL family acetyltransferase involved in cellulose biosynthesis
MRGRLAVEEATPAQWGRALEHCPWATFFQTPDWYEATASLVPQHRRRLWRIGEGDGATVFPFLERRTGTLLRRRTDRRGNAAGVYGGWVGPQALDPETATALLAEFARGATSLRIRLNPFHPAIPQTVPAGAAWMEETTNVIPLDQGVDGVLAGYASGQRRNIRAAQRAGVLCRTARPADLPRYLDLYHRTLARWGDQASMRYPDDVLLRLASLPQAQATLWLAERGEVLGAGILAFYHRKHVVLWHSANDVAESEHFPLKLLLHEILVDAVQRGVTVFDLNPSGGHEGPSTWKRLLGAKDLPAPVLERGVVAKPRPPPASRPAAPLAEDLST